MPLHPDPRRTKAGKYASRKDFHTNLTRGTIENRSMMAISNSPLSCRVKSRLHPYLHWSKFPCQLSRHHPLASWAFDGFRLGFLCLVLISILLPVAVPAATPEAAAARAHRIYTDARALYKQSPADASAVCKFAEAVFEWAEFANSDAQRADLAQEGIEAAQHGISMTPSNAACCYYLALNFGQLARTKKLGALKLVDEMEAAFLKAISFDANVDYAGPHRSLGLLYRDAPGWPASIGSRPKAREHLKRAVELQPDFPENRLVLLESLLKWGDQKTVAGLFPETQAVLDRAKEKFTGEKWVDSWSDWDKRWLKIQQKAAAPSRNLEPPKHRS